MSVFSNQLNFKEDITNGKTPFCIGMQRSKLLTRKVASELSFVLDGGGVSDSVIEFANEWWNFRYQTVNKGIKLLGPFVGRKICGMLQESDRNTARIELSSFSTIILPIQFSYICDPEGVSSADDHWSLLVFFPKKSLFLHFDSGKGSPNVANFTAQNAAQNLFNIIDNNKTKGSFQFLTVECPTQQRPTDSGIHAIAITACLAKYLKEMLDKTPEDLNNVVERITQLIRCNVTLEYIVFLRTFLKRLHSKLHQKLYESVIKRRSFGKDNDQEAENAPQKRKLETLTGGNDTPRRKIEAQNYTMDLEEMEKDISNFTLS